MNIRSYKIINTILVLSIIITIRYFVDCMNNDYISNSIKSCKRGYVLSNIIKVIWFIGAVIFWNKVFKYLLNNDKRK